MYVFSECKFEVNGFIAQTVAHLPFGVIVKTDDVCCCCRPDEHPTRSYLIPPNFPHADHYPLQQYLTLNSHCSEINDQHNVIITLMQASSASNASTTR